MRVYSGAAGAGERRLASAPYLVAAYLALAYGAAWVAFLLASALL